MHLQHLDIELVYDKYAALIYGCIVKITGDAFKADTYLKNIFIDLVKEGYLGDIDLIKTSFMLKYAVRKTLLYLSEEKNNESYIDQISVGIATIKNEIKTKINFVA